MALKGFQKASLLLTMLDSQTAMELLKGQPPELIQKIAVELSTLDAQKDKDIQPALQAAQEFYKELAGAANQLHVKSFINQLLSSIGGKEKAAETQTRLRQAMMEKDPFMALSSASPAQLADILSQEPAQTVAIVLAALPARLATDVISRLPPEKSQEVLVRMTQPIEISGKIARRIGEMICKRLNELAAEQTPLVQDKNNRQMLRRVALVLSGLEKDKREAMLAIIQKSNPDTATTIRALMVTWDDIIKIENKSLQQALRNIEASTLAKALHNADPAIKEKIMANISERMKEMIAEEAALMGEPRKKDVLAAREEVAKPLREANEAGELLFIEESSEE